MRLAGKLLTLNAVVRAHEVLIDSLAQWTRVSAAQLNQQTNLEPTDVVICGHQEELAVEAGMCQAALTSVRDEVDVQLRRDANRKSERHKSRAQHRQAEAVRTLSVRDVNPVTKWM